MQTLHEMIGFDATPNDLDFLCDSGTTVLDLWAQTLHEMIAFDAIADGLDFLCGWRSNVNYFVFNYRGYLGSTNSH